MRKLRIDLSNKLTDYGVELLYRKLFDKNTEYNKAFFTSLEDIRKLRLYYSNTEYIESIREEVSVVGYKYLQFNYYYENLTEHKITRLVLEDEKGKILDIPNQYISVNDAETSQSNVTCIICRFVVSRNGASPHVNDSRRWVPVIVTNEGVKYIYEAWADMRNEKVNFIYTGNGEPNNNPQSCHIMHLLDDVKVRSVMYYGRYCLLEGRKPFPYNTTTLQEMGLGFYLKDRWYLRNYIATMDRNHAGDMFPVDRSSMDNPNTLEYDHPVLSLRLHDDDYMCVWYSGKKPTEEDETNFPNIAFSAKFFVNIIYDIWYDEDSIKWEDTKPIQDKGLGLTENLEVLDSQTIEIIEPDMFPTATVVAEINGSSPVPIYTACTWIQNYNQYVPVRLGTPSSLRILQELNPYYSDYDTDLGSFVISDYYHSDMRIGQTPTRYDDVRYIQTLAEADPLSFEDYGISVSFVNNRMELPPIIFEDKNLTYAFDFDNFDIPTLPGRWRNSSVEYISGTDYTLVHTLSENSDQLIYTGYLEVIPGSTLASNLASQYTNTFDPPEFHITQKSLTFEKDIDFTLIYTDNGYGSYYFAINIIPGSNLEHTIGNLNAYGYRINLSPKRPSAITMEEIEEGGSRTITLATAGRFKASNIPNFVPTFEGDFTFF